VFRPTADELWNTITHACGLVLSLIGAAVMLQWVLASGDRWRCMGCGVYLVSLVGLYASSTLSHSASIPDYKHRFRMLDQAFIYLLIVGTYTPLALVYLRTGWWLVFLGVYWSVALAGAFSKLVVAHRVDAVAIWIYVVLGWMPIVAAAPLDAGGGTLLLAGDGVSDQRSSPAVFPCDLAPVRHRRERVPLLFHPPCGGLDGLRDGEPPRRLHSLVRAVMVAPLPSGRLPASPAATFLAGLHDPEPVAGPDGSPTRSIRPP
jgi:hemolysin III